MLFDKNDGDNIDQNVLTILQDYENIFYISSIALREVIKLYNDGELKSIKYKSYKELISFIDILGIEIKPFTKQHVMVYASLGLTKDHKDPNDHMIISQSISDKIPIISSDRKFKLYENQGLQFILNER